MLDRKKTTENKRDNGATRSGHAPSAANIGANRAQVGHVNAGHPHADRAKSTSRHKPKQRGLFDALDSLIDVALRKNKKRSSSKATLAVNTPAPNTPAHAANMAGGNVGNPIDNANAAPEMPLFRAAGSPVIPEFICPNVPLSGFSLIKSSPLFTRVLVASAIAHILVITLVTFSVAIRAHHDMKQTLQVALVNSKTLNRPTDARLLAQHNLDAGGNTDADMMASTPLPYTQRDLQRALAEEKKKREELEKKVRAVMTGLAQNNANYTDNKTRAKSDAKQPNAQEEMENFLKMVQIQAQIQKEWSEFQKKPKKTFIGSRAEEYRFAAYIEDWRLTIEEIGNKNYPEAARRQNLSGSLRMTVGLNKDGTVESAVIEAGSGNRILDAAAVKIVDMGAPYKPFPAEIKEDTDILYITRTWTFTPGNGFETHTN